MFINIVKVAIPVLLQHSTLVTLYAVKVSALALAVRSSILLSPLNLPSVLENSRNASLFPTKSHGSTSSSHGSTSSSTIAADKSLPTASWPATPFRILIPIATPPQARYSLNIKSAYPVERSELAKPAILSACQEMIEWIDTLVPFFESYIYRSHTVIQDFDETGTVTLDLFPSHREPGLSRRLALRGFETLRALIRRYGEAELRFELWEGISARGVGRVTVESRNR